MSEKSIAKNLMIGLIYPAVLGTLMYSVLDIYCNLIPALELKGYLKGDTFSVIFKSILAFFVIIFYCCDFLYAVFTREFKYIYFLYDIIILIGLYAAFKAINLSGIDPINLDVIIISFISFFIFYLLWDGFAKGEDEDEDRFYKEMVKWEKRSLVIFILYYIIYYIIYLLFGFSHELHVLISVLLVVIKASQFIFLIFKKRTFYA